MSDLRLEQASRPKIIKISLFPIASFNFDALRMQMSRKLAQQSSNRLHVIPKSIVVERAAEVIVVRRAHDTTLRLVAAVNSAENRREDRQIHISAVVKRRLGNWQDALKHASGDSNCQTTGGVINQS